MADPLTPVQREILAEEHEAWKRREAARHDGRSCQETDVELRRLRRFESAVRRAQDDLTDAILAEHQRRE